MDKSLSPFPPPPTFRTLLSWNLFERKRWGIIEISYYNPKRLPFPNSLLYRSSLILDPSSL